MAAHVGMAGRDRDTRRSANKPNSFHVCSSGSLARDVPDLKSHGPRPALSLPRPRAHASLFLSSRGVVSQIAAGTPPDLRVRACRRTTTNMPCHELPRSNPSVWSHHGCWSNLSPFRLQLFLLI
jgi:hypothetical protein